LQGEKISGTFSKTNQNKFRIEKVIRKNKNSTLVKWSGYSSKFNSWGPSFRFGKIASNFLFSSTVFKGEPKL